MKVGKAASGIKFAVKKEERSAPEEGKERKKSEKEASWRRLYRNCLFRVFLCGYSAQKGRASRRTVRIL